MQLREARRPQAISTAACRSLADSPYLAAWLAHFLSVLSQMRDARDTKEGEILPALEALTCLQGQLVTAVCLSGLLLLIEATTRSSLGETVFISAFSCSPSGMEVRADTQPETGNKAETVKEYSFLACSVYLCI